MSVYLDECVHQPRDQYQAGLPQWHSVFVLDDADLGLLKLGNV